MIAVFSDASCYDVTVLQCYACSVKIIDIVFSVRQGVDVPRGF